MLTADSSEGNVEFTILFSQLSRRFKFFHKKYLRGKNFSWNLIPSSWGGKGLTSLEKSTFSFLPKQASTSFLLSILFWGWMMEAGPAQWVLWVSGWFQCWDLELRLWDSWPSLSSALALVAILEVLEKSNSTSYYRSLRNRDSNWLSAAEGSDSHPEAVPWGIFGNVWDYFVIATVTWERVALGGCSRTFWLCLWLPSLSLLTLQLSNLKLVPTSGPLSWLLPLSGTLFPQIWAWLPYFSQVSDQIFSSQRVLSDHLV